MPPVSSRTTSMSVRSTTSRRSGLASSSASTARTGRRFAYRPSSLRSPSSPCSGRGASGSVVSHRGPPTAASRTASALRHAARVSSVSAVPWASIDAPPKGCSAKAKSPRRDSTSSVGAVISGPIPSPGSTAMLTAMGRAAYGFGQPMADVTDEEQRLREQLQAERDARREAERLAAENARLLYDRQDELELLEMVAAASNEATAIEPALGAAIVHVCAHMRWPVGHAYLIDPATGTLRPSGVWYLEDEARYAAFREASEDRDLVPWLPTHVMATGESAWVTDLAEAPSLNRREVALAAGLRAGFAFPILIGTRPAGALEFFTGGPATPDPGLRHVMDQIGVQLGRVVERERWRAELE